MIKRHRILFTGIVQGVGFRPFIYTAAQKCSLNGFVQNRSDGVIVEVEGQPEAIANFLDTVMKHPPVLADIKKTFPEEIEPTGETGFQILKSQASGNTSTLISPDIATCDDCLRELLDPQDRRYLYPFINCTNCGPRLTIIRKLPYDRCNTSMAGFPLCPDCAREYSDPADRRFHAQPNACSVCGPRLALHDSEGSVIDCDDPLKRTIDLLKEGAILAIKGIGGFHLCVDASNSDAVIRLRKRKFREAKPLAIMVADIESARKIANINKTEEDLLLSYSRPIVLLRKNLVNPLPESIAPGLTHLGVMLPYAPLHHLLFYCSGFAALVMTSANHTDEPICIGNDEAFSRLKGIADYFLVHNRDIIVRCDDSIAHVSAGQPRLLRRSRGFAPKPLPLSCRYPNVLALGAHMKATICIIRGDYAFLSPHIGDMETPRARDFFHENIHLMEHITECEPDTVACDLHPGYYSSRFAQESRDKDAVIHVQHHHAHIISCMAENCITGDVLGIALDGTGYGQDGNIWGGEFLQCDEARFTRAAHITYFPLPGGEKAIHEPWRTAAGLIRQAFGKSWHDQADSLHIVPESVNHDLLDKIMDSGINTPVTSSMGRLFDGVASILGIRQKVQFEGQAAMELEAVCSGISGPVLPYYIHEGDVMTLDFSDMIRALVLSRRRGDPVPGLAASFHATIIRALSDVAERIRGKTGLNRAVLSGGCFQNRLLLAGSQQELLQSGFDVYTHKKVPTNDGGIALGQALCAARQIQLKLIDTNNEPQGGPYERP